MARPRVVVTGPAADMGHGPLEPVLLNTVSEPYPLVTRGHMYH